MTKVQELNEKQTALESLIKNAGITVPKEDDLIEGTILEQKGSAVYVDISPFGTGIIYGREYTNARDIIKVLKPGDKITAKVIEMKNEMGYVSLSLKEAAQEIVWREAEEAKRSKTVFELEIKGANKGGLILEWKGVQGFLPASQLKTEHYPRIEDGDKDRIFEELKKLTGQKVSAVIISSDSDEKKLIFSEKGAQTEELEEIISKYKVGDIIEGEVTGSVEFGIFVKIEEGLEGLVHISELNWSLVENPSDLFKVGDKVQAKIISIKDGKISLSIKALKPNPWEAVTNKYKKGDIVKGVVIKFNKHGALVSIEEGVSGLVHISEFASEDEMKQKLELGKTYPFQITLFEPKEQRLTLSYLEEPKK